MTGPGAWVRSARAAVCGTYPSVRAASSTFFLLVGDTPLASLSALETVKMESPQAAAMSFVVGRFATASPALGSV